MTREELDAAYRTLTIIWGAIAAGVATFAGIVWAITGPLAGSVGGPTPATSDGSPDPLHLILLTAAAMSVVGGVIIRRSMAIPAEGEPATRFQRYQTHCILAWGIQDGGGLMAIVAGFLAGNGTWALLGAAVTLFGLHLTRPDRIEVERLLR